MFDYGAMISDDGISMKSAIDNMYCIDLITINVSDQDEYIKSSKTYDFDNEKFLLNGVVIEFSTRRYGERGWLSINTKDQTLSWNFQFDLEWGDDGVLYAPPSVSQVKIMVYLNAK